MSNSVFELNSLVYGSWDWATAAGLLAVVVAALAIWSYATRNQLSRLRFVAMLLKILAAAALAFCLLEPMKQTERPRPGANVFSIVVDNSRSMEIRPPGTPAAMIERLGDMLSNEAAWQARLAQDFDVRRYAFDDRLRAVEDLAKLTFQGTSSSLADTITTLESRFAGRPVAGMLLITDGLATDEISDITNGQHPFPIYPLVVDSAALLRDVSVHNATAKISSFELAPASVLATVRASGMAGRKIIAKLIDAQGETLEQESIDCDSDDFEKRVRFQFRPIEPGFQIVQIRAMLATEESDSPDMESRVEVTTANNSRLVAVDRGGGPYRILYVAGRPNWEFKFIRRAIEEDIEVQLHGLVRIAKEEPKFSFRDQGIETSNPLLAGFGDDETAEQYDEPILLRLGVEEEELKAGFPGNEDDLYHYHAIILDDVEASFFTQQQQMMIRQFVAQRGGGLMMLGGQESFQGGGYRDTPLGDVLPVYLRHSKQQQPKEHSVRYRLTREGSLEPWLRLRANQRDERQRVDEMPDFLTWHETAEVKPGASILAQLVNEQSTTPGLVVQRFGKGRSLALLVGDFWRWSMRRATKETDDLAQNWRQIARWLTSDVPRRVEVTVEPARKALDPHRIVVQLRDPAFKPQDNGNVLLTVVEPDGQTVSATAIADPERLGHYTVDYWSKLDGGYRCEVQATGPDGEAFDHVVTGWTAEPSAREFARIKPDRELLADLAKQSGGELVPIGELESFVASLPTRKVPITESRIEPLWHRPWFVLFAISCLCLEWGLRRWKGLP